MKKLLTTKTFWAAIAAGLTVVGGFFAGEISGAQAIQTLTTGAIGICIRHGMITTAAGGGK